jgi:hypothetical protein
MAFTRATSPPHLIVDLGVGRDRVAARYQRVGGTDELSLLIRIARGLIRTAVRDRVKTNMLRLPVGQRELKTLATSTFDGLWRRRPPVDDDPTYGLVRDEARWWVVHVDRLERQGTHGLSR